MSVLLATIVSNTLYTLWYQIPWVTHVIYGPVLSSITPMFNITMGAYVNTLAAVIGLSLLITKKGALHGFLIGTAVALFFPINAYLYSFIAYPLPDQTASYAVATCVGLLLFYSIPGALLGHFRKN